MCLHMCVCARVRVCLRGTLTLAIHWTNPDGNLESMENGASTPYVLVHVINYTCIISLALKLSSMMKLYDVPVDYTYMSLWLYSFMLALHLA